MSYVIKRNGKKVSFNKNKIISSIQKAAKDSGVSSSRTKELIEEVANPVIEKYHNRNVKSSYLRAIILRRLDRKSRSVSNAWRNFDKKRRR